MPVSSVFPLVSVDSSEYLSASSLTVRFGERVILDQLSLKVAEGEVIALVGPSGCGKSTLFNVLCGLLPPDSGELYLHGTPFTGERNHAAYMFQDHSLLPWRSVLQNVLLPAELEPEYKELGYRQNATEKARSLLIAFGLGHTSGLHPAQLSGGMKQRVALARTFMADRPLYLFDEPFTALDLFRRLELEQKLAEFIFRNRKTCLIVTHDVETALAVSHRVLFLNGPPCRIERIVTGMAGCSPGDPVNARTRPEFEGAVRQATETLAIIFAEHASLT